MKKYLSYCLVMLICVLSLTGCDAKKTIKNIGQPKEIDYPGESATGEEFEAGMKQLVENISGLDFVNLKANIKQAEKSAEQDKSYLPYVDALKSYEGSREELGSFKEVKKITYVEDRKNLYLATIRTAYAKRDCKVKVQFTMDDDEPVVKSITFDPVYSLKETLTKAGMNTLLGMGTVFSVLILIAFIISLFEIINKIETAAKEREAKKVKAENAKEIEKIDSTPVVEVKQSDDNELIAVIAAAIAASEGNADPGSFVVRSIRKIR